MPALLSPAPPPEIPPWTRPPETTAPLDWAPLPTIDLSLFSSSSSPDSKKTNQKLAADLQDAVKRWGFWVVTGSGIPDAMVERQLAIAQAFFKLPVEEKRAWECDFSVGNYFGYREPTRFIGNTDVKENMEMLNIPKFTPHTAPTLHLQHPFLQSFHAEIAPFHKLVFDNVIRKLLVLFAIMLELPEEYFVERHCYEGRSEDHLRYMLYHPRSEEEDAKTKGLWSAGHTDFGSLTLLFSQTVAALQIRTPSNDWKWVKPVSGGIVCNAADTLSFLTKGYIKSTIHRVVRPPPDQTSLDRLGLFYFLRPGDDVDMVPAPSPVLVREGFVRQDELDSIGEEGEKPVKGLEYVRARVKDVHYRSNTRVERGPEAVFRVKNLQVPDLYV